MDSESLPQKTLIYDRDCDLCRWSQRMLSRWDRLGRIRYLAFQEPLFRQWFPDYDLDEPPRAMLFIDGNGKSWEGFEAFQRMLPYLPWGRVLGIVFFFPGAKWASIQIYEWIAKNRYRFQRD